MYTVIQAVHSHSIMNKILPNLSVNKCIKAGDGDLPPITEPALLTR